LLHIVQHLFRINISLCWLRWCRVFYCHLHALLAVMKSVSAMLLPHVIVSKHVVLSL